MTLLKYANLALSFLLELCMLAAFAYWGFQTQLGFIAGIGVPLLVAIFWGIFMAPRSSRRVSPTWHLLLQLILFGAAALALASAGQPTLAAVFAVAVVVNVVLAYLWKQT